MTMWYWWEQLPWCLETGVLFHIISIYQGLQCKLSVLSGPLMTPPLWASRDYTEVSILSCCGFFLKVLLQTVYRQITQYDDNTLVSLTISCCYIWLWPTVAQNIPVYFTTNIFPHITAPPQLYCCKKRSCLFLSTFQAHLWPSITNVLKHADDAIMING